ncbi:hypothetical protein Tco_0223540, partial [Tanacetum coccineum]
STLWFDQPAHVMVITQTVVATSTTEAEYVAAASCCRQVGDEAVHKELGDRMERAATTASSLEAEQDSGSGPRCQDTILGDVDAQTRFETTSKQSNNPPLSRGYTQKSDLIRYPLTVNPTIYTSCIKQFWSTAKAKMVNGERQIQSLIDKKKVIITETSIRSDLHLEDAGGTDIQEKEQKTNPDPTGWERQSVARYILTTLAMLPSASHLLKISLKKNVNARPTKGENVFTQQYIMFALWSSISSNYKRLDDKAEDDTIDDDAYQEKEATEQSNAVRKEFEAQCDSQLFQEKITRASSTNSFNTVSTPVNIASASRTFSPVGPSSGPSFAPFDGSFSIDVANLPHDPLMPKLEDTNEI